MGAAVRYAAVAMAVAAALVVLDATVPQRLPVEVHLAAVGAVALVGVVRTVAGRCDPRAWRAEPLVSRARRPAPGPAPAALGQWIGLVAGALDDGRAATGRLAPRLAALAADRLAVRQGIDATADRSAAEAALGPVASRLAWPPAVQARSSPGVSMDDLAAAVDAVERLS